jgi:hypothetical protein
MSQTEREQHAEKQTEEQVAASGAQAGMQTAARSQEHKIENQQFLNELRKSDLDSDVFGSLEQQYPSWFSGAHAVTNRSDSWDTESDLLMQNKRERAYAERNPGRLLRDRPMLLAIAQGRHEAPRAEPLSPMKSRERRAVYGAGEVAADLMALSKDGAGLEATTTATTETRVTRESEESGTASKVSKVFE